MRWGLVPSWTKELSVGSRMFNARGETVAGEASLPHCAEAGGAA